MFALIAQVIGAKKYLPSQPHRDAHKVSAALTRQKLLLPLVPAKAFVLHPAPLAILKLDASHKDLVTISNYYHKV
jgi:hypothetical protein